MENVHFRTTIDVDPQGESQLGLTELIHEVADWIRLKEGPSANFRSAAWFGHGGTWKKANGRASVEVDSLRETAASIPTAWAIRYSHQDNEFAPRWWTIDVGVVPVEPTRWRLALTVGNSLHRTFMGQEPGRLPVTPPRLLTALVSSTRWRCSAGSLQFSITPTVVNIGEGHRLRDAIQEPSRCCALVYVSRDRAIGRPLIDAEKLNRCIVGSGSVYVAGTPELDEELEYLIPFKFRAPNGMVRVYAPGTDFDRPEQAYRHRFFTRHQIAELTAADVEQQVARSLARRTGWAKLVSPISSVDDIASQRREHRRHELQSEGTAESYKELLELYEHHNQELTRQKCDLEKLRDNAERGAEDFELLLEEARDKVRNVEYERDMLRQEEADAKRQSAALELSVTTARSISALPTSLAEVVETIGKLHGDCIAFTDDAIKSARKAEINKLEIGRDLAWKHLHAAATLLPKLAFDECVSGAALPRRFKHESGLELAMTEGKATKAHPRLVKLRIVSFEGKEWDITPHIKYGVKPPRCLRIHFALDGDNKRVIIGHCGDHLETAGTRRKG